MPNPPLPGRAGADGVRAEALAWATSAPLRRLAAAFGGMVPRGPVTEVLAWLDGFSAAHWDFRGGGERSHAVRRSFDPATSALITSSADALGLVRPAPPRLDSYTHVLVLGGLFAACLDRTAHAAALLASGTSSPSVTAVGGFRPLMPAELAEASSVDAGDCVFEVEAMTVGARRAFGAGEPSTVDAGGDPSADPHRAWRVETHHLPDTTVLRVVAAPSSAPAKRRANTPDTCRFWADQVAKLGAGDRVLVVTSAIYVPFQHCDAVAAFTLPYGAVVDTVGSAPRTPPDADRLLQEIRSAIRSMRRLVAAL
ncbi:hypothetical protein [Actinorhabdospora filicis]|uniref:hypothetical protein n=1 Tax=Actinorhabdospora filicis TaxID=1785913 RepID=UPI0025566ABD|nr:hypothetical protein [Actinorhabdospora filicis]